MVATRCLVFWKGDTEVKLGLPVKRILRAVAFIRAGAT